MNPALHRLIREIVVCAELLLMFEYMNPQQHACVQEIHKWGSFLSNLCENTYRQAARGISVIPYYRTMDSPFNRVTNYTDTLLNEVFGTLSGSQRMYLEKIRTLTVEGTTLLDDILESYTRGDAPLAR